MQDYPQPVLLDSTIKIIEEMKNNICKISIRDEIEEFGFFCKIPYPDDDHTLPALITTCHFINKELLEKEKELILLMDNDKNQKHINLEGRIKYTNEYFNFALIEIKEEKDDIHNFFELDENIKAQDTNGCIKETIYILQNSKKKMYVSYGILYDFEKENDCNFVHLDCIKEDSIGSPILNLSNNKIIGMNIKRNDGNNSNIGLFINYPLEEFLYTTYYKKMSLRELVSKYNVEVKNNIIEKVDLHNYNLGNNGLSCICEIKSKELKELKELNLNGNDISDISLLHNSIFFIRYSSFNSVFSTYSPF